MSASFSPSGNFDAVSIIIFLYVNKKNWCLCRVWSHSSMASCSNFYGRTFKAAPVARILCGPSLLCWGRSRVGNEKI